jgi:prepilin-type N-terminal cleavage/methylation domain-containing protein
MKITPTRVGGFTITELIVTVAVVGVLAVLFLNQPRSRPKKNYCFNNLKNVGLAFRIYATDNNDRYPWEPVMNQFGITQTHQISDVVKYFLMVTNGLSTPKILACTSDLNRPQQTNWGNLNSPQKVSYFIGVDARETLPHSFLAGDRNAVTNGVSLGLGVRTLRHDAKISWDGTIHQFVGNTVMGDGRVEASSSLRLKEQLGSYRTQEVTSVTWIVP